jgi:hypothetical protein
MLYRYKYTKLVYRNETSQQQLSMPDQEAFTTLVGNAIFHNNIRNSENKNNRNIQGHSAILDDCIPGQYE